VKQRFWILALLAGSAAAHADAVLEYSGGDAACHGEFTRLAVEGLSLRVDSPPPQQDMSFVYDAAEKAGVALDHRRKQFFEIEFDDDAIDFQGDVMKSTSHMVDRKVQQVQAQLPPGACMSPDGTAPCAAPAGVGAPGAGPAGMPQIDPKLMEQMMRQNMQHMNAEQRAQMEAAMKNLRSSGYPGFGPQSQPVVEATGERREIDGLACAVERVTRDGQLLREDCRAGLDTLGLDAADLKRLQRAFARMEKFSATIRDNMRFVRPAQRESTDPQHLLVARRCFDEGKPSGEVALHLRRESAPAEWFATPADYARMDTGGRGGR
jgi:hypothetical protein